MRKFLMVAGCLAAVAAAVLGGSATARAAGPQPCYANTPTFPVKSGGQIAARATGNCSATYGVVSARTHVCLYELGAKGARYLVGCAVGTTVKAGGSTDSVARYPGSGSVACNVNHTYEADAYTKGLDSTGAAIYTSVTVINKGTCT